MIVQFSPNKKLMLHLNPCQQTISAAAQWPISIIKMRCPHARTHLHLTWWCAQQLATNGD